ncbi:MAG: hypothetical protein GC164_06125 [Phycisphaera sp.]|nr:hypothetical protein [Phycisphaera sp.]
MHRARILLLVFAMVTVGSAVADAGTLKLHNIFTSHMVLQRDKPIKVWGWATPGQTVDVQLGDAMAESRVQAAAPVEVFEHGKDYAGLGRWEVTFPARPACTEPIKLVVTVAGDKLELEDILIGDVWVMYGQSNMAIGLSKELRSDMEAAQAHLPMLRMFSITGNEQSTPQDDIRPETIEGGGWLVTTPETAREFSAIGYVFGSRLQRSLQIPIGLVKNARGGASIESMVPICKFDEDPLTKRYADYIRLKMAEFDPHAAALEVWQRQVNRAKSKGNPESQWPKKPIDAENLTSWNIPGKSPSDMASVYNGMFGVFKGYPIKGVLFHQGYNNATTDNCRPRRYRVLTRLMIEGIREDFNDPDLAFGIIGFCAGGNTQNEDNFEGESNDPAPYIREAQRLGLGDVANQKNLMFLPAYDAKVPGLHPGKKQEHGERAARWALAKLYPEVNVGWRETKLLSAQPIGDAFVLTFDSSIISDARSSVPRGFSIAGADGKFYMAYARYAADKGHPSHVPNVIRVWSPLVKEPVAVRYAWARSPMGNLKNMGHPDRPFPSFRTDNWDYPESEDPAQSIADGRARKAEAEERLEYRRTEEARRGVEILERIKALVEQPTEQTSE